MDGRQSALRRMAGGILESEQYCTEPSHSGNQCRKDLHLFCCVCHRWIQWVGGSRFSSSFNEENIRERQASIIQGGLAARSEQSRCLASTTGAPMTKITLVLLLPYVQQLAMRTCCARCLNSSFDDLDSDMYSSRFQVTEQLEACSSKWEKGESAARWIPGVRTDFASRSPGRPWNSHESFGSFKFYSTEWVKFDGTGFEDKDKRHNNNHHLYWFNELRHGCMNFTFCALVFLFGAVWKSDSGSSKVQFTAWSGSTVCPKLSCIAVRVRLIGLFQDTQNSKNAQFCMYVCMHVM